MTNDIYRRILGEIDLDAWYETAMSSALVIGGREQLGEATLIVILTMLQKQFDDVTPEVVELLARNVMSRKADHASIVARVRDRYLGMTQ